MYFSDPVLFEIPVRPRIRKYISAKLTGSPLHISETTHGASLWLWALAQSQKVQLQLGWRRAQGLTNSLATDGAGRVMAPGDMTERLNVTICEFHHSRHQYLLNYAELETFSSWVDYILQNELGIYIQSHPDQAIMASIKAFVDRYDFSEDDIAERTLQQIYLRSRKQAASGAKSPFNAVVADLPHFAPLAA